MGKREAVTGSVNIKAIKLFRFSKGDAMSKSMQDADFFLQTRSQ
jgi:hypothetical protein